jgi:peroxiredoxin (alkyl hydroperoxide reductase subunit C)
MLRRSAPFGLAGVGVLLSVLWAITTAFAVSEQFEGRIYALEQLKPVDSEPKLKVGDKAPDFSLPSLSGETVALTPFLGKKNVVISFVPAAWTPVCSEQWPGYNIAKSLFDANDAIILGVSVDNMPTLYAWTQQMGGVWFTVLSDFWPHGEVAGKYGVLRSNGTSERALFIVDKQGAIRYIDVHDINERPSLEVLIKELEKLKN